MEIEKEILKRKEIQSLVISFIENDDDDEDFQSLTQFINENNFSKNSADLRDLLNLLSKIANNHYRGINFFSKIIQIIKYVYPDIQTYLSNKEIYSIFCQNHAFTLHLITYKIIILTDEIISLTKKNFQYTTTKGKKSPYYLMYLYLYYEAKQNNQELEKIKIEISNSYHMSFDTFQQYCQNGENELHVCYLIRHDSLNEFIKHINEANIKLDSDVPRSVFETNDFLNNNMPKLIEYAAFFGSIQIFKYLQINKVKMRQLLLEFAVHGRNPDIIHLVEENVELSKDNENKNYFTMEVFEPVHSIPLRLYRGPINALIESIKCHHNDIAYYIEQNNFEEDDSHKEKIIKIGVNSYNYEFIPDDFNTLFPLPRSQINTNNAYNSFYSITKITLPSSLKEIAFSCFYKFVKLKEIIIPSSVTSISDNSFKECISLEQVTFVSPSSLILIGKSAFSECSSLKQITIPASVTSIGSFCFKFCTSLTEITFSESTSLSSIENNMFEQCSSLKQLIIPSSVTSIKDYAFLHCSSLIDIKIPSSVTSIGKGVFENCTSLVKFTIPSSITSIEGYTFQYCSSLNEIVIPSSVESIGNYSFRKCSSLIQITIPNSVIDIGKGAFENCGSLKQAIFPSSITIIKDYTFNGCSSLIEFNIPSSVVSIGNSTFKKCESLTHISIPPSVTLIGKDAFSECLSLSQVTIHSLLSKINDFTFYKCMSLTQINIPSSVTEIGSLSFYGCSSLSNIEIPSSINDIDDFAFYGCSLSSKLELLLNEFKNKDDIHVYIRKSKELYFEILNFLDSENDKINENLLQLIREKSNDEYDLIELLNLLSRISENHHDCSIEKVGKIINIFKDKIKEKVSNKKVCHIFKDNKKVLVYLIENHIIDLDNSTANIITNLTNNGNDRNNIKRIENIFHYFYPELKQIGYRTLIESSLFTIEIPKDFNEKRKKGQNDSEIAQIIREDSIDKFIQYLNESENTTEMNSLIIPNSIYETNSLLMYNTSYIQYAAFYGSIKIFNYLLHNDKFNNNSFDLLNSIPNQLQINEINSRKNQVLWLYAIEGNQSEIIHILEENDIKPLNNNSNSNNARRDINYYYDNNFEYGDEYFNSNNKNCFDSAIKSHNNEIARYIFNNNFDDTINFSSSLQFSNYLFLNEFYNNSTSNDSLLLYNLCSCDYPKFAQVFLQSKNMNLETFSEKFEIKDRSSLRYIEPSEIVSDKDKIIKASIKSNNEIIKFLLQNQRKISFNEESLFDSIINENNEIVKIILLNDSSINVNQISYISTLFVEECLNKISPLFLAIINRNIEIIKLLLKHPNIDVNLSFEPKSGRTTYRTALHMAISLNDIEIVKLLLNKSDINVNAYANFDESSNGFLNWSNANHFDHYYSPLHEAVELNNLEIVKLLLKQPNILVNKIGIYDNYENGGKDHFDRVKQTALCRAIQKQNFDIVKLLLEQPNIDVNVSSVYHQNDTNEPYCNYLNNGVEEEANEEENEIKFDYFDEDKDEIIVKRSALQFAYAGKSKDIIQLLLSRDDIETGNIKDEENDDLIKKFTRDIK